jgi:hydroxyquinol 1,2-dioxygenase
MTQFHDQELTAEVIRSFDATPDTRLKFILEHVVTSLHDLVRRTNLTFE